MKVTVDTNVLISATFWYGDSNKIIELAEQKKIGLILSKEIIEEYKNVLDYEEIQERIKNKNLEMKQSVQKIISISKIIAPTRKINIVYDDPDDNKVLECAVSGNVDCIITKDKHLLKIKEFQGIKIVTPEEFLESFFEIGL